MKRTTNYNLNKPEASDPIRVADFNQNSDIIDAALAAKADQSAVTALAAEMAKGAKIATGSYTGTGTYGEANPTTLSFDFAPKMVVIWTNEYRPASTSNTAGRTSYWSHYFVVLLPNVTSLYACVGNSDAVPSYPTFNGNTVQVYNENYALLQWNANNTAYHYLAIG